jgi:hypothetical protein
LASFIENVPPPVGGLPATVAVAFAATEPATFGVGVVGLGAGVFTIEVLVEPAPFTWALALPTIAAQAAIATTPMTLKLRM